MALKDLGLILNAGHKLPIDSKTYTVPLVPAAPALRFAELMGLAQEYQKAQEEGREMNVDPADYPALSDEDQQSLYEDALGPAYQQMVDDDVSWPKIKLAATYVLIHDVMGAEQAESFWNAGGKAPRPNRAARRTATRTPTGGGTTTPKRASRTTTSTPKAKPQTKG